MAVFITVHHHTIWHQRIQGHGFTFTIADNLRIGISPEEQVRHQGFSEYKRGHLHGRALSHRSAGGGAAEQKTAGATELF